MHRLGECPLRVEKDDHLLDPNVYTIQSFRWLVVSLTREIIGYEMGNTYGDLVMPFSLMYGTEIASVHIFCTFLPLSLKACSE